MPVLHSGLQTLQYDLRMADAPTNQSPSGSPLQTARFLIQPVKRWTSEHLQAVKLEILKNAVPTNILSPEYLPLDGDEGMATVLPPACMD